MPPPEWTPDPAWGPAPEGWQFWTDDGSPAPGRAPAPDHASFQQRPGKKRTKRRLEGGVQRAGSKASSAWSRAASSSSRHLTFGGAGLVLGLLLGMVVGSVAASPNTSPGTGIAAPSAEFGTPRIEMAVRDCALTGAPGVSVGDEGRSVTVQTVGEDSYYGAEVEDLACILSELEVSDSVMSRIDSTRALDGRQTGSWDDFEASWGYHPDDGVNLVIDEVR